VPFDVIGHEWLVQALRRDLAHDRVRHAYLFTGPEGVGKRTLAGEFARALLCPNPDPPCGQCRHCQLAARGAHPDLLTVEPERAARQALIRVEAVRRLIYDLALKPVEAGRRVARLLDFHAANDAAMNAFLKTLEEPPGRVVILLTAEHADELLPTIVSRCQVLALRPLPRETVREALITRWLAPADRAGLLAHLAQGRLGWAVGMLSDEAALEARAERLDDLSRLVGGTRVERFAYAERLAKDGVEGVRETLAVWLGFWRDVLLAAAGAGAPLANPDREAEVRRLAAVVPPAEARVVLAGLRRTSDLLGRNVNTRLALEVCLMEWPRVA
jgi:DNA polymerase-3 subunit delta'